MVTNMRLSELLNKAGMQVIDGTGDSDPEILDICYDSRKVVSGSLYVSIPGTRLDGDSYIKDAISRGAVAVISENPQTDLPVRFVQSTNLRNALGRLGASLWEINIQDLFFVGITGTNGKTTTAHLFEQMLRQKYSADRTWMFGTVDFHLGEKRLPADHTTPEALDIFRYIGKSQCRPEGLVMEVSSHSLALDRVGGMLYDMAVWTNLTQDHLDFHHDMVSYYQAKKRLFTKYLKPDGIAVINIDDPWGERLRNELTNTKCVTYGRNEAAQIRIFSWKCDWDGCRVDIEEDGKVFSFSSSLRGYFNVYNMAAMIAGARGMGCSAEQIQKAFDCVDTVPGRMDRVDLEALFSVVVDYAHTPDALENILKTARPLTGGRLICVFGCGGDRDKAKRPIMGRIVSENCDEAIVTSDNPRTEKPQAIIDQILDGIPLDFPHTVFADRRQAIMQALSMAREGDCVVIAGKGHEDYQEIDGVKHHFNDKEVVMELLAHGEKK